MSSILEIAEKYIGYKESPVNKTMFGSWFGLDGQPWCAMFVSYCYDQAGKPLGNIGFTKGFAGCQTAVKYFTQKNKVTDNPIPGDIVFFDWQGDGKFDHTGIFDSWHDDDWFYCIEGNTSLANQSNGGEVMRRQRNIKHAIFVHP